MGLKKQTGNMYNFISHTWNPIKGECFHDCKYCYMKRFELKEIRLDEKELRSNLGENNFIFVGSGTDIFAENVPREWIERVVGHCNNFDNRYLFQSKNPFSFRFFNLPDKTVLGTTLETNRNYREIMGRAMTPAARVYCMAEYDNYIFDKMLTIEPILDFDISEFVDMIKDVNPDWVNIGADSKGHGLPEPDKEKIKDLIFLLSKFTEVKIKPNLERLMR